MWKDIRLAVCAITVVYFIVVRWRQRLHGIILWIICATFTNKIDCFTDCDGDRQIWFKSIFTILFLSINYFFIVNKRSMYLKLYSNQSLAIASECKGDIWYNFWEKKIRMWPSSGFRKAWWGCMGLLIWARNLAWLAGLTKVTSKNYIWEINEFLEKIIFLVNGLNGLN